MDLKSNKQRQFNLDERSSEVSQHSIYAASRSLEHVYSRSLAKGKFIPQPTIRSDWLVVGIYLLERTHRSVHRCVHIMFPCRLTITMHTNVVK